MTFLYLLPIPLLLLLLHLLHRRHRSSLSRLRNRHVWVIGASRGLGRAISLEAASYGALVSISSRTSSALSLLATSLSPRLGISVPLDVTASWSHLHSAVLTVESVAPVDVLILNAGINHAGKPFLALERADVDAVLATNLQGVVRLLRLALPSMLASRKGRGSATVCVVSSLAAYRGVPGGTVYGASKAAVTALVEALRVEMYDKDVDVVAVHPGFVDTDAIRALHHPKPFMMGEERAARETLGAVVRGEGHYGFPWVMEHAVMRVARWLPESVYEFVMFHTAR